MSSIEQIERKCFEQNKREGKNFVLCEMHECGNILVILI